MPLLIGCAIIPFLFWLRQSLQETDEYIVRKSRPSISQILGSLKFNWRVVLIGTMMVTMTTVSFYMITAYTPTFGSSVLHLAATDSLVVTLCVGASNLLVRDASFSRLLAVELWLSFIYGSYNGAMVVFLTVIMPIDSALRDFLWLTAWRRPYLADLPLPSAPT